MILMLFILFLNEESKVGENVWRRWGFTWRVNVKIQKVVYYVTEKIWWLKINISKYANIVKTMFHVNILDVKFVIILF